MNIAFVSFDTASPSQSRSDIAAQREHLLSVARELGRDHKVTVYSRKTSEDDRDRVRVSPGVTLENLSAGPAHDLPEDGLLPHLSGLGEQLTRRWCQERPDVVHARSWIGGLAAIAGADGLDVPLVQSFGARRTRDAKKVRVQRAIARRAAAVVAGCGDEESEMIRLGVPRNAISVIPCGVDVERFRRQGPAAARANRPRLLHVGSLAPGQGAHTALRALEGVPEAELLIAGGPAAAELEHDAEAHRLMLLAKELRLEDRVTFLGHVPHASVAKLMRSADVVLSLPREAAGGAVALESMACGVPVIASSVGAHLDSVVDGVTGLLVPAERPAQTARLARELLADPTRRTALGFAGADRARSRYSWERIAQEFAQVYEGLLATRHAMAA
ncbi:glycosyltransferase [Streptosporangium sp. NPDC004379]|uniref:glycosyltransferase n=1 Tax=Streptosporangium sp. NPDC004379 TaxID=3366189 RepID=UPI0036D0A48E